MTLLLNMFRTALVFGVALIVLSGSTTPGQAPSPENISIVYAQGKILGQEYKNDYFGLSLKTENAHFTAAAFVSSQGQRARLVDAVADAKSWKDKYEIAVLADLLSANPLIRSPEQYVRSVRLALEREGLTTLKQESPAKISSIDFVSAVMQVNGEEHAHYRGLYTTFLNGYILSLDVSATSPERLTEIVQNMVHFKNQGN